MYWRNTYMAFLFAIYQIAQKLSLKHRSKSLKPTETTRLVPTSHLFILNSQFLEGLNFGFKKRCLPIFFYNFLINV